MQTLFMLKKFLQEQKAPYEVLLHREVYTAQELAQALHTPGRELAKAVVLRAGREHVMAVLPASRRVDLRAFRKLVVGQDVSVVPETELDALFPDAETGAMPPFGFFYRLAVWVDDSLADDEFITFNAGSHYEALRMKYADYIRLARPRIASFTMPLDRRAA